MLCIEILINQTQILRKMYACKWKNSINSNMKCHVTFTLKICLYHEYRVEALLHLATWFLKALFIIALFFPIRFIWNSDKTWIFFRLAIRNYQRYWVNKIVFIFKAFTYESRYVYKNRVWRDLLLGLIYFFKDLLRSKQWTEPLWTTSKCYNYIEFSLKVTNT